MSVEAWRLRWLNGTALRCWNLDTGAIELLIIPNPTIARPEQLARPKSATASLAGAQNAREKPVLTRETIAETYLNGAN